MSKKILLLFAGLVSVLILLYAAIETNTISLGAISAGLLVMWLIHVVDIYIDWRFRNLLVLTGKDAERFERSMKEAETKRVPIADYERAKKAYESVIDSNEDD